MFFRCLSIPYSFAFHKGQGKRSWFLLYSASKKLFDFGMTLNLFDSWCFHL